MGRIAVTWLFVDVPHQGTEIRSAAGTDDLTTEIAFWAGPVHRALKSTRGGWIIPGWGKKMKQTKLYNVISPIWLLLFFPPIVLATLAGNFVIDSLVLLICFSVLKLSSKQYSLKVFYKKSILKVWLLGFLADLIGAAVLLMAEASGGLLALPNNVISGVDL